MIAACGTPRTQTPAAGTRAGSIVQPTADNRGVTPIDPTSRFIELVAAEGPWFDKAHAGDMTLFVAGKVDEAEAHLLQELAAAPSPARKMVIANSLYGLSPATSRRLHTEVYAAMPSDASAAMEYAMEEHRAGDYARAAEIYEALALAGTGTTDGFGGSRYILLADCLLHLKRYPEAFSAFVNAEHGKHHTGIESTLGEIYGPLSPWRRRADLIKRISSSKKPSDADALLKLDTEWDIDWWNQSVKFDVLEADVAMLSRVFGPASRRAQEYGAWRDLSCEGCATLPKVRAVLGKQHLLLAGGRLPESTGAASALLNQALESKALDAKQAYVRFSDELRARCPMSEEGEACNVLAYLAIQADNAPALAEANALGMKHHAGDLRFLESAALAFSSETEFSSALNGAPNSAVIHGIRWAKRTEKAPPTDSTADEIAGFLRAEMQGFGWSMATGGGRASYVMKSLFYKLGTAVGARKAS